MGCALAFQAREKGSNPLSRSNLRHISLCCQWAAFKRKRMGDRAIYCSGLENRRAKSTVGLNPTPSSIL
jgi:hypothetical protein